jgi:hypothetical protein
MTDQNQPEYHYEFTVSGITPEQSRQLIEDILVLVEGMGGFMGGGGPFPPEVPDDETEEAD